MLNPNARLPPPPHAAPYQSSDPLAKLPIEELKKLVHAQPWTMYDTRYYGASAAGFPGDNNAANNFAQIITPIQFFNTQQRLISAQNGTFCSNSDLQKLDMDFVCRSIGVDVFCSGDCASTAGISTAQAFVETMVYTAILRIDFASDPALLLPLTDCPAGGGLFVPVKIRTQGVQAFSDSAVCNNGLPTFRAIMVLDEPLVFPRGQAVQINIHIPTDAAGTAGPLHRLQNLQALTSDFNAMVRVKLRGVRGKQLLLGVTQNPDLKFIWRDPRMWN